MKVIPKFECALLEKYTVAPAPSRDYYGIKVFPSKVLVYHWKISRSPNLFPTVRHIELDKFVIDPSIQDEIEFIFGKETLRSIINVAEGNCDYLSVLSFSILICILSFLRLSDIAAVASTCKRLSKIVSTNDDLWMHLYKRHNNRKEITKEEKSQIRIWGWRRFFKNKFYLHQSPQLMISQLQNKKIVRPHSNVANKKKELAHIPSPGVISSAIQNKEHPKDIILSDHIALDKKAVTEIYKTPVTAVSRLRTMPMPISKQSSDTRASPHNKSKNARTHHSSNATPQPLTIFKHMPSPTSENKQNPVRMPQTIKLNTTKNTVKSPKLNKIK